jgi:large subunit ribosomal protein L15
MSLLSTLEPVVERKAKRLGRGAGSGKGAKSGRGTTRHQTAREKVPLHFEGGQGRLVKKYPLLRGKGKNKTVQHKVVTIPLAKLNSFKDGDSITFETLYEAGFISRVKRIRVKIVVSKIALERTLTVHLPVSKNARQEIEKRSGKVQG